MKNLVTKRNVTILNLALLGVFLITLVAVGVTFFGDDPKSSLYAEEQTEVRTEAPPPPPEAEKPVYACPRHPEETTDVPGKCPQCETVLRKVDRYASIEPRNLFFDPSLRPPKIVTPPPLPPLQLQLVGVTKYPEGYVAIIRDKSKRIGRGFQEYIVREQQELPNHFGVTVASISPEPPVVKLDRAGVGVEELRMGEGTGSTGTAQAQQWDEVVRPVRKDYTYLVKYKELQARNLNLEGYRGTFGLEPVTEGTRVTGLRITSLPRDNFLYAAGLKQGDVMETINGKAITGEDAAIEHLTNAAKGFSVQLGITRGRSKRTLIYTLLKN